MNQVRRGVEFPLPPHNENEELERQEIPQKNLESENAPTETSADSQEQTTNLKPQTTLGKLRRSRLGKALQLATLAATVGGVGAKYGPKIRIAGAEAAQKSSVQAAWDKGSPLEKFTLPTQGHLPDQFSSADIDPRYAQVKILESLIDDASGVQKQILQQELQKFQGQLSEGSGWADKGRQNLLNSLVHDPGIRDQLSKYAPTMADAVSLLKATIMDKGSGTYQEKLAEKINQRAALEKTEFIGPHTDEVIIFNYASKDAGGLFKGDQLVKMAQAGLGKKAEKDPGKYVHLIDTEQVTDVTQETAGDKLIKAIEAGKGNMTLYLNTHASETELAIDLSDPKNPQTLKVEGFASALLNRLSFAVQQGESLNKLQTKIIIDGCEGYNLAQNTVEAMRKMYDATYKSILKVEFDQLPKPEIVTMAGEDSSVLALQEGSFEGAKASGSRALVGEDYLNLIQQEGGLTGKVLLKLQAETYTSGGDMTFFAPNQGKLEEISSFKQPKKASSGTFEYGGKKLQYGSSEEDKTV